MSAKNFGATSVGLVVGFLAFSDAALAQESVAPTAPAMPAAPAITPPAADLITAAPQVQATFEAPLEGSTAAAAQGAADESVQKTSQNSGSQIRHATEAASKFLRDGGPSIWAIAALSVVTLALILWKTWRLLLLGAWSRGSAHKAVAAWEAGDAQRALSIVAKRRGLRSRVVAAAIRAHMDLPEAAAREETTRVAKLQLAGAGTGLRALELIASIAPLLGLLGTVLGMIAAFQALQESGSRADPSLLAGGIWEALLTTAAGMAVAIPASAALTWFEAVVDGLRRDVEDAASRIFLVQPRYEANEEVVQPLAAE